MFKESDEKKENYPTPTIPTSISEDSKQHYRLWCYLAGSFTYFLVKIDPSELLDDLKRLILNEQKK
jgi:hypothetical protein